MIVLECSALIAILNAEPERVSFLQVIAGSDGVFLSAVTLLEARIVIRGRFGDAGTAALNALLSEISPEIVPFDGDAATIASAAFERFGKGMGNAAQLNICDCASYALAKLLGLPLLFKGNDFSETDIVSAA